MSVENPGAGQIMSLIVVLMMITIVISMVSANAAKDGINGKDGKDGINQSDTTKVNKSGDNITGTIIFSNATNWGHVGGTSGLTADMIAIQFKELHNDSKPIIEWRDQNNSKIAWITAHEMLNESNNWTTHKHISIETAKADMTNIVSRLEVDYGKDISVVSVSNANLELSAESQNRTLGLFSLGWQGRAGNGIYYNLTRSPNTIEMVRNNITMLAINSTSLYTVDGASTNPAYSFLSNPTAGVWLDSSNTQMKLAIGGGSRLTIGNAYVQINNDLRLPLSPTASPVQGSTYLNTTLHLTLCYDSVWRYCGNGTAV